MSITESETEFELTTLEVKRLERRLALRVLAFWRDARKDRPFAAPEDLDPSRLGNMWPHCYLLRVIEGAEPVVDRCGDAIEKECGTPIIGRPVSAIPNHALIHHAVQSWRQVLSRQVPVTRGGDMENAEGALVLFRSVLIPISADQMHVTHLFGAVNGRVAGGGAD